MDYSRINFSVDRFDEIINFKHVPTIRRFALKTGASLEQSNECFVDLMRWFILIYESKRAGVDFIPTIYSPMTNIDHMWHCFILHTGAYMHFCHEFFNDYIHHNPIQHTEADIADVNNSTINARAQCELVYRLFGSDVVKSWFLGEAKF
ncbi:hypothetical protein [Gayadomonas joobiniege]|uniref:hypothetical protein n=1 Tax=Gayadomonas joobiniege TaxID=1234606 RepID=UPI00035CCDF3|nr:hypothetical protein [Gayadomonas joobiniege]